MTYIDIAWTEEQRAMVANLSGMTRADVDAIVDGDPLSKCRKALAALLAWVLTLINEMAEPQTGSPGEVTHTV